MRRPPHLLKFSQGLASLAIGGTAFLTSACFSAGEGIDPPQDRVYFPVGLAVTLEQRRLVVANSDFDLQYNAGTLQVLDLERLRSVIPKPCGADADCHAGSRCDSTPGQENGGIPAHVCVADAGRLAGRPCGAVPERALSEQLLYPGRCDAIDPAAPPDGGSLIVDVVRTGAFATDVIARVRPPAREASSPGEPYQPAISAGLPERVFLPVRGDTTLHWADLDEQGNIHCGQELNGGACDGAHRAGDDPDEENTRGLRLAPEPFAIDATEFGDALLVSNQASGQVSLFYNDWSALGPRLQFALGDLPARPVGIASLPLPGSVTATGSDFPPGFLVTFRSAPEVHLIRYFADAEASPDRPYLTRPRATAIHINSVGSDSRGIAVDASARRSAELECATSAGVLATCASDRRCVNGLDAAVRTAYLGCLNAVAATPLDVFVANRSPSSLLIGRTTPAANALQSTELPAFYDSIPLTLGPSRVHVAQVIVGTAADGQPLFERRVLVVCFDSRRVFVYDPTRRRIETEIATGRGPHALAFDQPHGLLFVGHFTDSFIGVVSLDRRFPHTYGKVLATVGKPTPPRASK